jgi:hypothetical protein
MPTITLPHAFASGDTTDPAKIAENIYSPNSTPDSFDVLNGWLELVNLNSWEVSADQIQRGEMTRSDIVGAKSTIAWPRDVGTTTAENGGDLVPAAMQPIPGCGQSFTVPFACTLAIISWGLYYSTSDDDAAAQLFYVQQGPPGSVPVNITSHVRRTVATANLSWEATSIRWWRGCRIIQSPSIGDWNIGIRLQRDATQATEDTRIFTDWRYCNVVLVK